MLQHAQRSACAPLFSVLQAAASRAWVRTMTGRAREYHRTSTAAQGNVVARDGGSSSTNNRSLEAGPSMYLLPGLSVSEPDPPSPTVIVDHLEVSQTNVTGSDTLRTGHPSGRYYAWSDNLTDSRTGKDIKGRGRVEEEEPRHAPPDLTSFPDTSNHRLELLPQSKNGPPWCAPLDMNDHPRHLVSETEDSSRIPSGSKLNTTDSLHRALLDRIISRSLPRLPKLMLFHADYPHLQSAESYNLLLSFAMEQNNLAAARILFEHLRSSDVNGDIETRKLWVRYMVKTNRWMEAWKMETSYGSLPLRVWLEFLTWDTPFAPPPSPIRRPGKVRESQPRNEQKGHLLMHQFPVLVPGELANTPPRAIFAAVRWIIRTGNRDAAWQMTTRYFELLPPELPPNARRICLDIIHLHLLPRSKREGGVSEYNEVRRTLSQLLGMHPGFRPNSDTLFYLLRTLRRAQRRTDRALEIVQKFKKQWGEEILNERIRRRVASFAVQEGRAKIAESMLHAHEKVMSKKRTVPREEAPSKGSAIDHKVPERPPRRELFPRHGAENWRWLRLRRRVERASTDTKERKGNRLPTEDA